MIFISGKITIIIQKTVFDRKLSFFIFLEGDCPFAPVMSILTLYITRIFQVISYIKPIENSIYSIMISLELDFLTDCD